MKNIYVQEFKDGCWHIIASYCEMERAKSDARLHRQSGRRIRVTEDGVVIF